MAPEELVEVLSGIGVGGCNIEDSDHAKGGLIDVDVRAAYIAQMRAAADRIGVNGLSVRRGGVAGRPQWPSAGRRNAVARGPAPGELAGRATPKGSAGSRWWCLARVVLAGEQSRTDRCA
ncbi:hypothetical protein [Streptomyces sp. NPDC005046]